MNPEMTIYVPRHCEQSEAIRKFFILNSVGVPVVRESFLKCCKPAFEVICKTLCLEKNGSPKKLRV